MSDKPFNVQDTLHKAGEIASSGIRIFYAVFETACSVIAQHEAKTNYAGPQDCFHFVH